MNIQEAHGYFIIKDLKVCRNHSVIFENISLDSFQAVGGYDRLS